MYRIVSSMGTRGIAKWGDAGDKWTGFCPGLKWIETSVDGWFLFDSHQTGQQWILKIFVWFVCDDLVVRS